MSKIGDYMRSPVLTTTPDALAYDAVDIMDEHDLGALLVEENGKYIGIFTKTDWNYHVLKEQCDPLHAKVSSLMVAPVVTVDKNETLANAGKIIENKHIRHLAVTDQGRIVGMLSVKDLESYYRELHHKPWEI